MSKARTVPSNNAAISIVGRRFSTDSVPARSLLPLCAAFVSLEAKTSPKHGKTCEMINKERRKRRNGPVQRLRILNIPTTPRTGPERALSTFLEE
jgi:hypothetical protein